MPVATVAERRFPHAAFPPAAASSRRGLRRGLVAALGAGAVFVLIQGLLAAYNLHLIREAIARLLTRFAVESGGAQELNPFVRTLGLPFKLVAVGALGLLLYKRRPAALVWPIAALLWVLCYHVSGIVVNH